MAKAATDTLAPDDHALQESFWGRGGERRRSRSDHPTARIGAPSPAPRRRAPSASGRRRGNGRVFLTWLLVATLLAGVVAGGWWWRNRDGAPARTTGATEGVESSAPAPVATVSAPVTVFSHRAADGRLDLAMAVGTDRTGSKSAVLLLAPATQLEVPANGIQQLAELNRLGGDPLVELGIENALGIAVDRSVILDDAGLQALFDSTGQLLVTLPAPVTIADPALNLPAGPQTVTPQQAVTLLIRKSQGATELDHLATVRAVLDAWFDALASGERAITLTQSLPSAAPFATAARTGATIDVVPVDSIGLGTDERYVIAASDAQSLVSGAFPDAIFTTGARPRIEIRGSGDPEILAASGCIVRAGGNIRLTGRTEPADNTSVVFYRDREIETAQRMQAALGAGSVKRADRDLDLVDVTIVVGKDFIGCQ